MPQSGARGFPVMERRNITAPEIAMAAETLEPAGTATRLPLTVRATGSGMETARQVRSDGDRRPALQQLVRQQFGRGQCGGNP